MKKLVYFFMISVITPLTTCTADTQFSTERQDRETQASVLAIYGTEKGSAMLDHIQEQVPKKNTLLSAEDQYLIAEFIESNLPSQYHNKQILDAGTTLEERLITYNLIQNIKNKKILNQARNAGIAIEDAEILRYEQALSFHLHVSACRLQTRLDQQAENTLPQISEQINL